MTEFDLTQKRPKKPTMMDVAALAGVSQATVSLVLNGSPTARLAEATRERVRQAATALGYEFVSRGTRSTGVNQAMIGVVVDEMSTDPWMAIALDGIRERAWEAGLTVTTAVTRGDPAMEESIFEEFSRMPLIGLIYGTILTREIVAHRDLVRGNAVLLNCYVADGALASVLPDDEGGGRRATQVLIDAGRKRIGLINGQEGLDATADRLAGYRSALDGAGLPFDPALVRAGNWEPSSGYEETLKLLDLPEPPDGIFCANDMMAFGALEALKERGLRIPEDVAVIGFDDREIALFTHPTLTTLVLPLYEMGTVAADLVIRNAREGTSVPDRLLIDCPLVLRDSV